MDGARGFSRGAGGAPARLHAFNTGFLAWRRCQEGHMALWVTSYTQCLPLLFPNMSFPHIAEVNSVAAGAPSRQHRAGRHACHMPLLRLHTRRSRHRPLAAPCCRSRSPPPPLNAEGRAGPGGADPLRVLRAVRFGARFGFRLDAGIEAAAASAQARAAPPAARLALPPGSHSLFAGCRLSCTTRPRALRRSCRAALARPALHTDRCGGPRKPGALLHRRGPLHAGHKARTQLRHPAACTGGSFCAQANKP
jgi:hypothetical protein